MPKVASTQSIKYTIVQLEKNEFHQVVQSIHDSDRDDFQEQIIGFISNGEFWHPCIGETYDDSHWTGEIVNEYPDEFMIVLLGPPNQIGGIMVDLTVQEKELFYVTAYDTWETSAGQVAIVTESGPD